jgi:putative DNA-invertase from lambdoid prophage Rac
MAVFGYTRVSTQEQSDEGVSLDAQRSRLQGYAMAQGWTLTDVIVEAGVSGSVPFAERPAGSQLLAMLQRGDVVIAPKLDRAFRNAADALTTLEEFKADGIDLHLIDLGGSVVNNGVGKLVFTILAAVAENERDRIRERIRDAKRHMAAQGLHSGGSRKFGHDIVEGADKVKRLVPNTDEQAIIDRIKALRAEGLSLREIGQAVGKPHKAVDRILKRTSKEVAL